MTTEKTPADLVDDLGFLKAQIAELTNQETELKAKLSALGLEKIDGHLYSCTISQTKTTRLESDKVRAFLTPSQIAACSKTTEGIRVAVTSRTRSAKAK